MLIYPFPPELIGWLKVLNPEVTGRLGKVSHALFDFDGTLSVLREGWEDVMIPMMVEMICENLPPEPAVEEEVRAYVDSSTGILTIQQMGWLVEIVRRHRPELPIKTAREYKAIYLRRLMEKIRGKKESLVNGATLPKDQMIDGAHDFLEGLHVRGVTLYLVSGTDHDDVIAEARALRIFHYFTGGIYGALDERESQDKAQIIERILADQKLLGEALLVVGDGPVEIREAVARGAISLGVASNEIVRSGWNWRKIRRLSEAGADILVPDYLKYQDLLKFLFYS